MRWKISILLIFVTLSLSTGAFGDVGSSIGNALEPADWGGHGAALRVLETGAFIEFDCAIGRIHEPVKVQHSGRFSVTGKYHRERGGPVRFSEKEPKGSPAVFSGVVTGSELLIHVELPDEGRSIGPFNLKKSLHAELEKCL